MAIGRYFMSPRSDLTIRNLTAEQIELICNAAVDIVGGRVSFSESAIYESEPSEPDELVKTGLCPYPKAHVNHRWSTDIGEYHCPGRIEVL